MEPQSKADLEQPEPDRAGAKEEHAIAQFDADLLQSVKHASKRFGECGDLGEAIGAGRHLPCGAALMFEAVDRQPFVLVDAPRPAVSTFTPGYECVDSESTSDEPGCLDLKQDLARPRPGKGSGCS